MHRESPMMFRSSMPRAIGFEAVRLQHHHDTCNEVSSGKVLHVHLHLPVDICRVVLLIADSLAAEDAPCRKTRIPTRISFTRCLILVFKLQRSHEESTPGAATITPLATRVAVDYGLPLSRSLRRNALLMDLIS